MNNLARLQQTPSARQTRNCHACKGTGERHPDNDGRQYNCQDCSRPCGSYMVKDSVWRAAWPEYAEKKRELRQKYAGTAESFRTALCLCLGCLQHRLGRPLGKDDFDLTLPINDAIMLGLEIGSRVRESRENGEVSQLLR